MTTDPTATHHAEILDWLSAALTDDQTDVIRLEQGAPGQWDVYVEKSVDPAVEVKAQSQADADLLLRKPYDLGGVYTRPAWVDEALKNPDPDPRIYDDGRPITWRDPVKPTAATKEEAVKALRCQCQDCRDLDAILDGRDRPFNPTDTWEKIREAIDQAMAKKAEAALADAQEALKAKPVKVPKESMTQYLQRRYGGIRPEDWYQNTGYLKPGQKVTNDDGLPFRLTTPEQWEAILADGTTWEATAHGKEMAVTFSLEVSPDLLAALYGYPMDDETGVAYRVDTPEGVAKAKADLFRPEDES